MRLKFALPAFLIAFLAAFIIACQSEPIAKTPLPNAYKRAVVVSAGNGGPVTVYLPTEDGKDAYALTGKGGKACADCKTAATKFFQGGDLEPTCPSCGGHRQDVGWDNIGHE